MTKRFHKLNSRWVDIEEPVLYDTFEQKALNIEQSVELLNEQQATISRLEEENEQLKQENNFLKQMREAFQIDVKNSRKMLKRWDKYE